MLMRAPSLTGERWFWVSSGYATFRGRLAELGVTLIETRWLGVNAGHRAICAAGHECSPYPKRLQIGGGPCLTCAGQDPATAAAAFREAVAALGATLLDLEWHGTHSKYRVLCAAGHACSPRAHDVLRGQGVCTPCGGRDRATAWAAFQARVAELGGILHEPEPLGSQVPHRATCAAGHECSPRPDCVLQGGGICARCAGKNWDVFYVVTSESAYRVKYGITSGDPRPRLKDHCRDGYEKVEMLLTGLPPYIAPRMERTVKAALRDAGIRPVKGAEYHDIGELGLILDVAQGYYEASTRT
jgi:hypothetical protein